MCVGIGEPPHQRLQDEEVAPVIGIDDDAFEGEPGE